MSDGERCRTSGLWGRRSTRWGTVIGIILALGVVLYFKMYPASEQTRRIPEVEKSANALVMVEPGETSLPRLIDLGADKCIPCKMMAPILEELRREYAGVFEVEIVDVWKNPEEVNRFRLKGIPTQIFFDAAGQELYRHMGFLSKEDILAKWKELGIPIEKGP